MSGNQRIDVGEITQSSVKGKGMESALASALTKATPKEVPKGGKQKKKK